MLQAFSRATCDTSLGFDVVIEAPDDELGYPLSHKPLLTNLIADHAR